MGGKRGSGKFRCLSVEEDILHLGYRNGNTMVLDGVAVFWKEVFRQWHTAEHFYREVVGDQHNLM